ncbi:universal stress protein [Undibacterium arcticum]|uniref:Universal stress protein n=1 Tax=Undibacterium arcticum TaxID=1762892 RepID=A0ABV7EZG3_9BURK
MYRKILVAYSGTPESRSALHECISLAPGPDAEIHLLAVAHLTSYLMAGAFLTEVALTAEEDRMQQELAAGHALMTEAGLKVVDHLQVGEPLEAIGTLVDQLGIDLVIVGHPRHKPWAKRWWHGSIEAVLADRVKCSILVATETHEAA